MIVETKKNTKSESHTIVCKHCKHDFTISDLAEWWSIKFKCPNCGELFCNLPSTEIKLHELQYPFLEIGNSDYRKSDKLIGEMHNILIPYAESIIKKRYRRYIQAGHDTIADIAHVCVSNMMEDFLSRREGKKNFYVRRSFAKQLENEIMDILFGPKAKGNGIYKEVQKIPINGLNRSNFNSVTIRKLTGDILSPEWKAEIPRKYNSDLYDSENDTYVIRFFKEVEALSLDYELEEGKTALQIEDYRNSIDKTTESFQSQYLENYLFDLTDGVSNYIENEFEDLKRMLALNILFEKGELYVDKFFTQTELAGKEQYLQTVEILMNELKGKSQTN